MGLNKFNLIMSIGAFFLGLCGFIKFKSKNQNNCQYHKLFKFLFSFFMNCNEKIKMRTICPYNLPQL